MMIVSEKARIRVDRSIKLDNKYEARRWMMSMKGAYRRSPTLREFYGNVEVRTFLIFDKRFLMWQGQVEVWTTVVRLEGEAS